MNEQTTQEQIDELNNTVWCLLGQSKIHGIGVIAIKDIQINTKITNYKFCLMNILIFTNQ